MCRKDSGTFHTVLNNLSVMKAFLTGTAIGCEHKCRLRKQAGE